MGARPSGQLTFVNSTWRVNESRYTYGFPTLSAAYYSITELNYTYRCATVRAAYLFKRFLEHQRFRIHLFLRDFKCSLCSYTLPTESITYTVVLGLPPKVQHIFLSFLYRITGLHSTCWCTTLNLAFVCKLYLNNNWVTLLLRVCHF